MGIYIKGMEMPKESRLTLQISADGAVYVVNSCNITAETYTTDVIPVPPHGRLIDADALTSVLETLKGKSGNPVIWDQMTDIVKDIYTVIEAEEGE